MYTSIKWLHLSTIAISGLFFLIRGIWMITGSTRLKDRWVRFSPHVVDTLLLGSGIALVAITQQYPLAQGWLTAKLTALIVYIITGSIALKRGRTLATRTTAWLLALVVFGYMVAVALTRNPLPHL